LELTGDLSLYEEHLPAFFDQITFESDFDEFFAKSTKVLDESEQEDESASETEKLSTIYAYAMQMDPNDLTALTFFEFDLYSGSTVNPYSRLTGQQNNKIRCAASI